MGGESAFMKIERVVGIKAAPSCAEDEGRYAKTEQFLSRQVAEGKQEQGCQPIEIENVSAPQQNPRIEKAEGDEPQIAPEIGVGGIGPASPAA